MAKELEALAAAYAPLLRTYSSGSTVYVDRSLLKEDCLIVSGHLLEVMQAEDERESSVLLLRAKDFFGPFSDHPENITHTTGRAFSNLTVLAFPDTRFSYYLRNDPALAEFFARSMGAMFNRLAHKYCNLATLSPSLRVIDFLVRASLQKDNYVMHISTEELAVALSTTRQTVSKVLSVLRKRELITTSYMTIKVKDPLVLQSLYLKDRW